MRTKGPPARSASRSRRFRWIAGAIVTVLAVWSLSGRKERPLGAAMVQNPVSGHENSTLRPDHVQAFRRKNWSVLESRRDAVVPRGAGAFDDDADVHSELHERIRGVAVYALPGEASSARAGGDDLQRAWMRQSD